MNRYQSVNAIVLRKKNIGESDFLITLLTPKEGKITALAKGAKNIKSSRLGNLQLGNEVKVFLYSKNDFTWISETKSITSFLSEDKTVTQLNLLFYFLELINRLIADNQQIEGVYAISIAIITAINKNHFKSFIRNEITLINLLGYGLPKEIKESFEKEDLSQTQKLIKSFLESIIEKPLESNKLFK